VIETIILRKGGSTRTLTLEGTVVREKIGQGKPSRKSWLNGVMARAKRDATVAELVAKGWTVATAKAKARSKSKSKSKRPILTAEDIQVVGRKPAKPSKPSVVRTWPSGYAEIVGRFGSGELEDLVILSPAQIAKRTKEWQKLAPHAEALFVNLREHFPEADEATLVVIAASHNGDVIGFPDSRPSQLFLFPRGSNRVVEVGSTFEEALGAWCYGEDIGPRRVEGRRARFTP